MTPRLRRLSMDSEILRADFSGHPFVRVTPVGWEPAEQYRVEYWVRGVMLAAGSAQPTPAEHFIANITLPNDYPRVKPLCTMETPVFHPNFGSRVGDEICIADYWAPSQGLSEIILKIGEMLQFRDYNTKSPLNAMAARWADENASVLPVGTRPMSRVGAARATVEDRTSSPPTSSPSEGETSG